jgi:hypothetical protein
MRRRFGERRGAASVETAALAALIALLLIAAVSAVAAGPPRRQSRELGAALARRLTCAPRLPDACRHHPLVRAYGWPIARLARAMARQPQAQIGAAGLPLVPVDFRYCRQPSCAVPGESPTHLTASRRRVTVFTSIADRRRSLGYVEVTYWAYRPSLGWEKTTRRATQADVDAAAGTPVLLRDDPDLVPLETIPGRDQYRFPAGEQPPWRWKLQSIYPG